MAILQMGPKVLLFFDPWDPARVNWLGVGVLLVGAVLGFAAAPIATRLWPKRAVERTQALCFVGLFVALIGTVLAVRLFG